MITVAICDDSKPMLESMKACLEEYGNTINHELHIFSFESGEELLNNYNCRYDIIFLDIKMPGMNGIEAAEKIREKDKKVNATITSVNLRKKEFAMMQSIGMTKKQLRILLLFESIGLITITLLISYFLNILVINIGVKGYLQTQWTATYNFTITPLLLVSPILIIIAVVVPIVCFNHLQKRELMDQLDNSLE